MLGSGGLGSGRGLGRLCLDTDTGSVSRAGALQAFGDSAGLCTEQWGWEEGEDPARQGSQVAPGRAGEGGSEDDLALAGQRRVEEVRGQACRCGHSQLQLSGGWCGCRTRLEGQDTPRTRPGEQCFLPRGPGPLASQLHWSHPGAKALGQETLSIDSWSF